MRTKFKYLFFLSLSLFLPFCALAYSYLDTMPDNTSSEKEKHMKQLKRKMECWREVVLPLNSILLWERPWYPALILGLTTTVFCMIWIVEPALLTLISLSLLVLALVDYFVPTIISIFCTADSWTGQKEKKLNEICHNLSEAILQLQSLWTSVVTMRNSRPNFYYGTIMIFLVLFAWLGNTINNLLLSYIAVNAILLTPGFKYKGRARSAVKYIHNYLTQEKLS